YDKNHHIVGKLSQRDVIKSLEPKYDKIGDFRGISRFGLTPEFMRSMVKNYALWESPMQDVCKKAAKIKVKDIMYAPTEGEYVEEEATIDQGIHQLIVGHHQSLLVTRGKDIIGVLRLTDVFKEVCNNIKQGKMGPS
ncbi:MAG: CBS domain-containing protein, partial [Pseudomonadota bacterium]